MNQYFLANNKLLIFVVIFNEYSEILCSTKTKDESMKILKRCWSRGSFES